MIKVIMNEGRVQDIEKNESISDWITAKTVIVGAKPVLPTLPDWMIPVVNGYENGAISKSIQVIPCSGQYWNELTNSQRGELLELVEWLGGDSGKYVRDFECMYPNNPIRRMK